MDDELVFGAKLCYLAHGLSRGLPARPDSMVIGSYSYVLISTVDHTPITLMLKRRWSCTDIIQNTGLVTHYYSRQVH